jgi:membrane protein
VSTTFDLRGLRDREQLQAVGKDLVAEIKSDDIASLAAAAAFKIVLALFPALLAAVAIFAMVTDPGDLEQLLTNLPQNVTEIVRDRLDTFIEQAASGGIAVTGILIGLWAASGAAATLNKSLSRAYDLTDDRKLIAARGVALAVTAALLLALIGISVLLVAGGVIENNVLQSLPLNEGARTSFDILSTIGRYLAAILLLMLLFAFIYWVGPDYDQRPRWQWITPGAALAVIAWLLASAGFGWYVANFGSYTAADSPYGPLGSAIVFMLWLQLSMFALLLGAELNQVLRVRVSRLAAAAGPAGAGDPTAGDPTGAAAAGTTKTAPSTGRPSAVDRSGGRPGVTDDPKVAPSAAGPGTTRRDRRERPGAHVHLEADTGDDAHAAQPSMPYPSGARAAHPSTHGHAVVVRGHDRDARRAGGDGTPPQGHDGNARRAGGHGTPPPRPDGDPGERLPMATVAGAAVAAVSSLAGLIGLLRRLRDG